MRSGRALLLFATAFAALCLLASQAFASKEVHSYFGGSGSLGGQFAGAGDLAANATGAGPADAGDVYVADTDNNRIQRFDSDGNFISAWGTDVVQSGGTGDVGDATARKFEICTVASECKAGIGAGSDGTPPGNETQKVHFDGFADGNTFTLGNLPGPTCSPTTTAAITWDSNPTNLQNNMKAALEARCGAGNFSIASGPTNPVVTFQGTLGNANQPTLACATVSGSGSCNISEETDGSSGGTATTAGNGALSSPQGIALDPATGNLYVSDRNNLRVNEYAGDGAFIRSFGFAVDADTAGDTYEVCPAADVCKAGIAGSGAGQIGSTSASGTLGLAVSPAAPPSSTSPTPPTGASTPTTSTARTPPPSAPRPVRHRPAAPARGRLPRHRLRLQRQERRRGRAL